MVEVVVHCGLVNLDVGRGWLGSGIKFLVGGEAW